MRSMSASEKKRSEHHRGVRGALFLQPCLVTGIPQLGVSRVSSRLPSCEAAEREKMRVKSKTASKDELQVPRA